MLMKDAIAAYKKENDWNMKTREATSVMVKYKNKNNKELNYLVELYSEGAAKLLEVYVDPKQWTEEGVNHTLDFDWMAQFIGNGNPDDYLDDKGLEELDNEV